MWCKVLLLLSLLAVINTAPPLQLTTAPGDTVLLSCSLPLPLPSNARHPSLDLDLSLVTASWTRQTGLEVASFGPEKQQQIQGGFFWDPLAFLQGNFSLTVSRVAPAHQGTYVCSISYNASQLVSCNVSLSVLAPPTLQLVSQWVVLDRKSRLECLAGGFFPPPVFFSWTRDGEEIQSPQPVDGELTGPDGLYRAAGNLSFYPTKESENATFGCKVTHKEVNTTLTFKLYISVLPSIRLSAVPSSSRSSALTLACDLDGFYPDDLSVSWVQNGTTLPQTTFSEPGSNRTFRTTRYFKLTPQQREQAGDVQCVAGQPGALEPAQATASLADLDPPGTTTPTSLEMKRDLWRDEKQKSLNVSGIILPPHVVVGKKGRVSLSIEGRRVDRVQTSWFLNDMPIADTSRTVSEKGPLLPHRGQMGYYKLHNQGPLHSTGNRQQLVSSLTFVPQISVHKGAVFKCQVSYIGKDKVVVERVSERFTVLASPEVSEIQLAEATQDSEVITMTVHASHFHPDVITFRWFCEGSELSPVASQASSSPRPDPKGFFTASSQCRLPRTELERGNTKVWVSVHHVALKNPVTRFIRIPCVAEIVSSISTPGGPPTLGCDITGFYPPDLTPLPPSLPPSPPSVPLSMSVCWSTEGVGVFSLLLRGGQPRARLLWTAGGATLLPLTSSETEEMGDDGQRELRSVCALQRGTTGEETRALKTPDARTHRGRAVDGMTAVSDPDIEGIDYIDEKVDGENNNNNMESWEVMKTLVDVRAAPRHAHLGDGLRVCVEITHPALALPVYRTWTEPTEEPSSI
ncbi:hypothetical protein NHX12_024515 [Muraenolepis orangiensis]|uniref:Ig-like domain-containing protein n=1 Tax=Muraenolepis orangiensis TaxID=630683 RepID=A0A9Q0IQS7_9TELE|nr:hypothetical protein NHX12_024515 [Muraenolepis orangiensis]